MTWFNGDRFGGRANVVEAYDRHAEWLVKHLNAAVEGDERRARDHLKALEQVRLEIRGRGWRVPSLASDVQQQAEQIEQQRRGELGFAEARSEDQ